MKSIPTRMRLTAGRRLCVAWIIAVLLLAVEWLLKHAMGAGDVVSVLFAAGPAAPVSKMALALSFVVIRFTTWVLLPGLIVREVFVFVTRARGMAGPDAADPS